MTLKAKIKKLLRANYGNFNTLLEHEYENKLIEVLIIGDMSNKKEWVTYNQVVLEIKNNLKDMLRVKELQYKLTDKTNPNDVCIEVLDSIEKKTPELERLYYKIKSF